MGFCRFVTTDFLIFNAGKIANRTAALRKTVFVAVKKELGRLEKDLALAVEVIHSDRAYMAGSCKDLPVGRRCDTALWGLALGHGKHHIRDEASKAVLRPIVKKNHPEPPRRAARVFKVNSW